MFYRVVKQSPMYRQMTTDDLFNPDFVMPELISSNRSNTRVYVTENLDPKYRDAALTNALIGRLQWFCAFYAALYEAPRSSLYTHYKIPKKSGGFRPIDQPNEDLMAALYVLKAMLETDFGALYHTSAFAYVPGRCNVDCVRRHQQNESRWFAKFDLKNFFGSTTLDFVMSMVSRIYPFCLVCQSEQGRDLLRRALSLGFLDGGLPQGTPLSPLLTNLMMIPIDYELFNTLRDYHKQRFVYTRYADDFHISSQYDFKLRDIQNLISFTLQKYDAPFRLNEEKTRYGSNAGSNWMLGVMLNRENQITVGHKNKRRFRAALHNFLADRDRGFLWPLEDVQYVLGLYSYYHGVEPEGIDRVVSWVNETHKTDVLDLMKRVISGKAGTVSQLALVPAGSENPTGQSLPLGGKVSPQATDEGSNLLEPSDLPF